MKSQEQTMEITQTYPKALSGRSKMALRKFFFPSLTRRFLLRACCVGLLAYLFFGYLCIPVRIEGYSMMPTVHDGAINFCWRGRYLFSKPKKGDIVMVRFAGNKVMLLKRIVAVEGEQVEFREGRLFIDGRGIDEPYVHLPCSWNLPPRRVEKGSVYVIGDNRSVPMRNHAFGQVSLKRIAGGLLW